MLVIVSINDQACFNKEVGRACFNKEVGMQDIPFLTTLLSVNADDLSKPCRSPEKLAMALGLPDSSVFQSTYGAKFLQLGVAVPSLNPKIYVRSLSSIGGRKHLVDAAGIAASLFPPDSAQPPKKKLCPEPSNRSLRSDVPPPPPPPPCDVCGVAATYTEGMNRFCSSACEMGKSRGCSSQSSSSSSSSSSASSSKPPCPCPCPRGHGQSIITAASSTPASSSTPQPPNDDVVMKKGAIWDAVRVAAQKQIEGHTTRLEQGEDAKSLSERSESRSLMQAVAGVALAYHGDLELGLKSLSESRHMSSFTHSEDPASLGNMLAANMKQFIGAHNAKGRRTDADQNAMNVVAALTVGINKGATQLGFGRTMRENIRDENYGSLDEPFVPKKRAESEATRQQRKAVNDALNAWCHDDNVWRPDSNGRMVTVGAIRRKQEGKKTSTMEGGEQHPTRFFRSNVLTEQMQAFKESEYWKTTTLQHPAAHIGKTWFRRERCRCCKHETKQACVDIKLSKVAYVAKALLKDAGRGDTSASIIREGGVDALKNLKAKLSSPYSVIDAMMCPSQDMEGLKMDPTDEKEKDFRLQRWDCARGACMHCKFRVDKLALPKALTECVRYIEVEVWKDMPRLGSSPQFELTKQSMTVAEACTLLVKDASVACEHLVRTRFGKRAERLSLRHVGDSAVHSTTDFAATVVLTSKAVGTCAKNSYANLNVFVCSHSPRDIPLLNEEGEVVGYLRVVTTDVWFHWGPTESKCKFNDTVFHNACLDHIVEHYKAEFVANGRILKDFYMWTDNCAAQYRGRKNMYTITKFYEKHEVHLHHSFAEVGQFKGPHDSAGKVLPSEIKKRTAVDNNFAADAEAAFLLGKMYKAQPSKAELYKQLEAGPGKDHERLLRVKGKRGLGHDKYFHGFVATDETQATRLKEEHEHVHYTNRTVDVAKNITAVPKSKHYRDFRSTATDGILRYRDMPCRCESCRKEEKCPHENITGPWHTLQMQSSLSLDLLEFIGDERKVERTFLEGGKVYVRAADGKNKTLNCGTLVAFRGDVGVVKVGVIGGGGGVVVYNLEENGTTYTLPPSNPTPVQVAPEKFIAATTTGKRGEVKSITLSEALRKLLHEVEDEEEEEVGLEDVHGLGQEGVAGAGDQDESSDEEGGDGREESDSEDENNDSE